MSLDYSKWLADVRRLRLSWMGVQYQHRPPDKPQLITLRVESRKDRFDGGQCMRLLVGAAASQWVTDGWARAGGSRAVRGSLNADGRVTGRLFVVWLRGRSQRT